FLRRLRLLRGCRSTLFCDDLILDLVVSRLRNDLLLSQFVLGTIGSTIDDLLCVGITDAWYGHEFLLRGRIDIDRVCFLLSLSVRFLILGCCLIFLPGPLTEGRSRRKTDTNQ